MSAPGPNAHPWLRRIFSTGPVALLLVAVVGAGTAERLHARLLQGGEALWPGYAELRVDRPPPPACDEAAAPEAPAADAGEDAFLDDLLGEAPAEAEAAAEAAALRRCEEAQARYRARQARLTPALRAYRGGERGVAAAVAWAARSQRALLTLLLLLGAATATATRSHIALRLPKGRRARRVSAGAQLLAAGALLVSSAARWRVQLAAGGDPQDLSWLWMAGFAAVALLALWDLLRPAAAPEPEAGWGQALLSVPLWVVMAGVASLWFFGAEGHPAGLAITVQRLTDHAALYLQVGLYVWAGMLLKQSRVPHLAFDTVRPWGLPPEGLAFGVVVASALPTAYSGASGIFVIAAGALIHQELLRGGARPALAGAATAMSGSLGVVLAPCLLVVIVASLNREVTTDQLYGWGRWVFAVTAAVFALALLAVRQGSLAPRPVPGAARRTRQALAGLLPPLAVAMALAVFYAVALDAPLDEHSAPVVLPVLLLAVLWWDRRRARPDAPRFVAGVTAATRETVGHTGALLTLMALSVSLGGVIERSRVVEALPADLGGPVGAMAVLVVLLVGIGMVMDPYGAVILVSAALTQVATANGIHPVHFWMVVLVAFELGYLTPPVALNHLLARQVVGDPGGPEPGARGWRRHERLLLPLGVMAVALGLVAFVPLFW